MIDLEEYRLPKWDGEDAEPITAVAYEAARLLQLALEKNSPAPDIAPGADGTVGFQWRFPEGYVFAEVQADGSIKWRVSIP